jgi:MoxR-like ATPase
VTEQDRDPWGPFRGTGTPPVQPPPLPQPPGWRSFTPSGDPQPVPAEIPGDERGRLAPLADLDVVRLVNAALTVRRPLLVTGPPGSGKSTLARLIAAELGLGPMLRWPITSSSQLRHGLYSYDALGRIHDANSGRPDGDPGRYLRLGPLGTALLPWQRPRVLLIDEIDKSDIDLPNDLLHVFEEGEFFIEELRRLPDGHPPVEVMTADKVDLPVPVEGGHVRCGQFPIVVMTSNDERTFPPAFLRRCLRLTLAPHTEEQLTGIVAAQLGTTHAGRPIPADQLAQVADLIVRFDAERKTHKELATDQLLHAVYLITRGGAPARNVDAVCAALLTDLNA